MAGNGRKSGTGPQGAGPSEEELAARLRALDRRLDKSIDTRKQAAGGRRPDNYSGLAAAMSLAGTFVSAILVGAAIGWGIDRFFGVAPWGMIVFLLLGFAAGVLSVMRAAARISTGPPADGDTGNRPGNDR